MSTVPDPVVGLVVRYDYLWHRESTAGLEFSKDRPACIVFVGRTRGGETTVFFVPITHAPPQDGIHAIEIPSAEKLRLGLDGERSWAIVDEINTDIWPNGLARIGPTGRFAYGRLSFPVASRIFAAVADLGRRRLLRQVGRISD